VFYDVFEELNVVVEDVDPQPAFEAHAVSLVLEGSDAQPGQLEFRVQLLDSFFEDVSIVVHGTAQI